MPPLHWTRSLTAGTEHALLKSIQFGSVVHRLELLFLLRVIEVFIPVLPLELGADETLLVLEVSHVDDQVFDSIGSGEWENIVGVKIWVHFAQAGKSVLTINVH